jgi:diguanylate cyclase (GGDEF)-like protein
VDLSLSNTKTISVLLVEDDPDYACLVRDMLDAAWSTEFAVQHVDCLADARKALIESPPDCILADLTLPDAHWLEAPAALRDLAPDVPLVILSGLEDESLALKAVHQGAQDYLVKGYTNAHLLGRSIHYAIERRQLEASSDEGAMYDSLTGLPNRNLFIERLRQARLRHAGQLTSIAVVVVHINNIELINDSLGRPVGKQLLQAVSVRMRAALPELGIVACFGSGLVGFICENMSSGPYRNRIVSRVLKSFEVPFVFEAETVFVTAGVGVALSDLDDDSDPEELIRRAQAAAHESEEPEAPPRLANLGSERPSGGD